MSCVAVEETLAEKVLSFLRQFAEHRAGKRNDGDNALVRHLYDVGCVVKEEQAVAHRAAAHFNDSVALDPGEFTRHKAFWENPAACMSAAPQTMGNDKQTAEEYETKLIALIHGSDKPPTFAEALGVFRDVARKRLNTIPRAHA
ncbi:hypothetical protein MB84_31515 (plasmid) [Pandoraea oxalativorans]|uniref:Uncharacterized protein n=2 Tax=Pandoraea oxalativorans TaxID=573737 RepID=A0A192B0Z6_9BURK|nr:hypothetical protein MB84_31515 [Pandoraea oxalativorans]